MVLNAANEVAVDAFLSGRVPFGSIPSVIEQALEAADTIVTAPRTLADVRAAHTWARAFAIETLRTLPSS